jgi:hypothetical protein
LLLDLPYSLGSLGKVPSVCVSYELLGELFANIIVQTPAEVSDKVRVRTEVVAADKAAKVSKAGVILFRGLIPLS